MRPHRYGGGVSESEEAWSALKSASVALNEMFVTMVDSGFTEDQALRLVAHLIEGMTFEKEDD